MDAKDIANVATHQRGSMIKQSKKLWHISERKQLCYLTFEFYKNQS